MRGVAVFDAYGTLFDTEGLVTRAEAEAPGHGQALVGLWRAKQLEYTWLRSLLDRYRDFWAVTRDALEFACEAAGLHLSAEARDRLMSAWLEVPAFPDAAPALSDFTARGVRCCVFSNGTRQMLQSAAASSGLNRYLDAVLSVDDGVRVYKPHPAAYEFVCHSLGVPREEVLFVSSNGFDVAGAASYGFPTAWVNRRGLPWERLGVTPHRVVSSLGELVAGWV